MCDFFQRVMVPPCGFSPGSRHGPGSPSGPGLRCGRHGNGGGASRLFSWHSVMPCTILTIQVEDDFPCPFRRHQLQQADDVRPQSCEACPGKRPARSVPQNLTPFSVTMVSTSHRQLTPPPAMSTMTELGLICTTASLVINMRDALTRPL